MRLTPASCSAEILANFSRSNFSQKSLYSRLQSILVCATTGTVIRPGPATTERARTAHARRFISGSPYLSSDGTPVARCDQIRGEAHKVSRPRQKSRNNPADLDKKALLLQGARVRAPWQGPHNVPLDLPRNLDDRLG